MNLFYTHTANEIPFDWDAHLPSSHNLKLAQLIVFEKANVPDIKPVYIWLKEQEEIVGLMYAHIFSFKPKYVNAGNLQGPACAISKLSLSIVPVSILTIGNLFRHDGQYFYFKDSIDAATMMHSAVTQLRALISSNALFVKDFNEQMAAPFAINKSFSRFSNDVSMQLRIPDTWNTFSDYTQALKHKYKQRLNKMQKSFADIQVKELSLEDVAQQQNEIFKLYEQVAGNQTITLGKLNAAYFYEFKKSLGDQLHIHGFYYQDKLVAFSSAIVQDGIYDMNYIGFDNASNGQFNLYFNMLFFFVSCAIEAKCHHLVLGRTALEAKAIIGCTPQPIFGYYTINNKLFYKLTQWVTSRLANNQGELWQQRHPFKSEYYETTN